MNNRLKKSIIRYVPARLGLLTVFTVLGVRLVSAAVPDPEAVFTAPPDSARTGVWWHWMGCNVSSNGIRDDLAYFKRMGIQSATIFGMADVCTPWATGIPNSPTAGLIAFTPRWWSFVRFAAEEGRKLDLDVGLHNCPGYTSTGGPWITPDLAMQELCHQRMNVIGTGVKQTIKIPPPRVDLHAHAAFPVFNEETHRLEKPVIEARRTHLREVALLAVPADGTVRPEDVRDLSDSLNPVTSEAEISLPVGNWILLRICHVPMGAFTQPNQWETFGLECDKMSEKAVRFHIDHVLGELKRHLGDLVGTGLKHILLDSYEAGTPTWTPAMRDAFRARRGYDLLPFLPTFAGLTIGNAAATAKFKKDFTRTVQDLYRDVLFAVMGAEVRRAGLTFACEPYTGPFVTEECAPFVDRLMTEFWTDRNPRHAPPRPLGWHRIPGPDGRPHNIIEAEAFTGQPTNSRWDETPAGLKPIGDYQFCRGINRFILHGNPLQPWDDRFKPGVAMGRWGTHFGRNQTWAEPGKAWFDYLARCQALLQWGEPFEAPVFLNPPARTVCSGVGRTANGTAVFFVANLSELSFSCEVRCKTQNLQPEWFDPVSGRIHMLARARQTDGGRVVVPLALTPHQSGFLVFRTGEGRNGLSPAARRIQGRAAEETLCEVGGPWSVRFDPKGRGPNDPVTFVSLSDWTLHADPRIRFFSGTATYRTTFNTPPAAGKGADLRLSLGHLKGQLARVWLNGVEYGTAWCEPYEIAVPSTGLKPTDNVLRIDVTNVWANRLIGDEHEPPDYEWTPAPLPGGAYMKAFPDWFKNGQARPSSRRVCFTTWNYFTKDSPLIPSGLFGPVRLVGPH